MRSRGFTFVELIMVLAILGVLATIAVPVAQVHIQRVKEKELRSALIEIRSAIDQYKRAAEHGRIQRSVDETGYPRSLEELVNGVEDVQNPKKEKIYFLRRIPMDPFMEAESSRRGAHGWGLRSYASSPQAPAPGADVFDVYSTSDKVGSNGVPYKQW